MFKRILIPTDGSAASLAAVEVAVALARDGRGELFGLHVTPLYPVFGEVLGTLAAPPNEDRPRDLLGHIERRAAAAGLPVVLLEKRADAPSEAILETVREQHCDLVVMGSRGRNPLHAMLLGSQTQAVLTHSPIPVLIVPRGGSSDS